MKIAIAIIILFFSTIVCYSEETAVSVLSLNQCIELAINNHPLLKSAQSNVKVYTNRYGETVSNYLSHLDFSSSYRKSTNNSSLFPTTYNNNTDDSYSASLGFRQLVYDFGRTWNQIDISKNNLLIQGYELKSTELNVLLSLKQAYYSCFQAQKVVEVNQKTVKQMEQHLQKAQTLYEIGTRPKFDVTKAEVDLSNAQLNLIKAKNSLRIAKINLNNTMGIVRTDNFIVFEQFVPENVPLKNIEELKTKSFKMRPDWLIMQLRKEIAKLSVRIALSGFLPTFNTTANYRWNGDELPLTWNWDLGISLSIPLFSGLNDLNLYKETVNNLAVTESNEESLQQNIILEIEQNYANWSDTQERLRVTEKIIEQAKETLELAEARYQEGSGSIIELTDAQILLSNAELNRIQTVCDYYISEAKLEKSVGGN